MALNASVLAPTTDASANVVVITVPAGETATIAAYTELGGILPDLQSMEITHQNPAGTFQSTGFVFGPGIGGVRQPQYIVGPGIWSVNKPETAIAVGIMVDQ